MTHALAKGFNVCFARPDSPINKRIPFLLLSTALLLSILLGHQLAVVWASPLNPAKLSPNPPAYIADHQGETFNVGLNISDVVDLHGAHFLIAYDSALLDVQQVKRGAFFPADAYFYFEVDEPLGLIELNMSLSGSHEPLSGGGVLAELSFEVAQAPLEIVGSPVRFLQLQLFNPNHEELDCNSVGAIFFWRSVQPSEPDGERQIDLYTLKGGTGLGAFGGWFGYGDLVTLKAYVAYADWPQQNLLVAFQVLNPLNETMLVFVTETDENGVAETSFRIPEVSESVGFWTAIASVDVACEIVWDTMTFSVSPPVGGETTAIAIGPPLGRSIYFAIVGILALGLIGFKKAFGGPSKPSSSGVSRRPTSRAQNLLSSNGDYIGG
jgi:hypothetical protein